LELLLILRPLWYRRGLLAVGVLAAVAILVAFGRGGTATATSAAAFARVRLDTPQSELVTAAPDGSETLSWRSWLMLHLMSSEEWKQQVAQRAGVSGKQLAVIDGALSTPLVTTSLALRASDAAAAVAAPYVLALVPLSDSQALISIVAYAPDPAAARKLADASMAVLASHVSAGGLFESKVLTGGGMLTSDGKLQRQPFVVVPVGSVHILPVVARALPLKALAAAAVVLFVWTAFVILLGPLSRTLTRSGAVAHST